MSGFGCFFLSRCWCFGFGVLGFSRSRGCGSAVADDNEDIDLISEECSGGCGHSPITLMAARFGGCRHHDGEVGFFSGMDGFTEGQCGRSHRFMVGEFELKSNFPIAGTRVTYTPGLGKDFSWIHRRVVGNGDVRDESQTIAGYRGLTLASQCG
jgi:hypothetical protein